MEERLEDPVSVPPYQQDLFALPPLSDIFADPPATHPTGIPAPHDTLPSIVSPKGRKLPPAQPVPGQKNSGSPAPKKIAPHPQHPLFPDALPPVEEPSVDLPPVSFAFPPTEQPEINPPQVIPPLPKGKPKTSPHPKDAPGSGPVKPFSFPPFHLNDDPPSLVAPQLHSPPLPKEKLPATKVPRTQPGPEPEVSPLPRPSRTPAVKQVTTPKHPKQPTEVPAAPVVDIPPTEDNPVPVTDVPVNNVPVDEEKHHIKSVPLPTVGGQKEQPQAKKSLLPLSHRKSPSSHSPSLPVLPAIPRSLKQPLKHRVELPQPQKEVPGKKLNQPAPVIPNVHPTPTPQPKVPAHQPQPQQKQPRRKYRWQS